MLVELQATAAGGTVADPVIWSQPTMWTKRNQPTVLIGDFNTGFGVDAERTPFACQDRMRELLGLGWMDAWRTLHPDEKEFTWYSRSGNGFRLDYAYLSPTLGATLASAEHSHREREERVSDHSALMVEVTL